MKRFITAVLMMLAAVVVLQCRTDARVASRNLEIAAEQFELSRRIVFFNGITDKYMLVIEGRCSIEVQRHQKQLEVTCKDGQNSFKKHHLGLSDNVSYFSEQIKTGDVSTYRYRVIFKPTTIVPDVNVVVPR